MPVVTRLVKEYEAKGVDDLKRYHVRASKAPDERSSAAMSTASSSNCTSVVSLRIIRDQQQKIQELQMQKKVRELALQEKDVEIKRGNIELKRKNLELDSYKQMVNELENVTEADEFIRYCSAQERANTIFMGDLVN